MDVCNRQATQHLLPSAQPLPIAPCSWQMVGFTYKSTAVWCRVSSRCLLCQMPRRLPGEYKVHWQLLLNAVILVELFPHIQLMTGYCKMLNVSMPFISRISRAKQNRKFKGREYQLQAKIGRNYYSISNCMVLIRQNKRGQNNFAC